jgi:hypothetical protein
MVKKRAVSILRMKESIAHFDRNKVQHLIINDTKEIGHIHVSELVIQNKTDAKGAFIWFLDDDDVCTCPQLPAILERILIKHPETDLIMTRSMIYRHGLFPIDIHWNAKNIMSYPEKAVSIMTPIVKREIFIEAIDKIRGHTHLIDTMYFKGIQDYQRKKRPLNVYHLDYIIGWQPYKLSTKGESIMSDDLFIQYGIM